MSTKKASKRKTKKAAVDPADRRREQLRQAQAALRERRHEAGKREIIVWVSKKQERAIRKILAGK
ncbi:MAG: hypothetical protein ACYDHY_15000 [Acidiferrobacterales bacterium]